MTNTTPTSYTEPTHTGPTHTGATARQDTTAKRWVYTETKAGPKTTEFAFMVLFIVGVLVATYIDDSDTLHAQDGWLYAAIAASAYFISRGLAKCGTREPYSDEV